MSEQSPVASFAEAYYYQGALMYNIMLLSIFHPLNQHKLFPKDAFALGDRYRVRLHTYDTLWPELLTRVRKR